MEGPRRFKKTIVIIISSIVGLVFILCLSGFLFINSCLEKVRYDPGTKDSSSESCSELFDETVSECPEIDTNTLNKQTEEKLENESTPLLYNDDVFNILLIGSDSRSEGSSGRSDTMILISINRKTAKIIATSLLRDIYVQIPGITEKNRLNTATVYGGPALLLDTIQQDFKIDVNKYVAVDFFSFMSIVDKIGGVSINISDAEIKVANEYIHEINILNNLPINDGELTSPGEQNLTGKQALSYARIRYVGNGDFDRTERQRTILDKVFTKVKTQNISQLTDLLDIFLPQTTTNLSKGELFSLILSMPAYSNYTIDSWHVPVEGTFSYLSVREMSVIDIDFSKNIEEMGKRIYSNE